MYTHLCTQMTLQYHSSPALQFRVLVSVRWDHKLSDLKPKQNLNLQYLPGIKTVTLDTS